MKTIFLTVLAGFHIIAPIDAEETKRPLAIEETFFGSSPTGYALLRTETEAPDPDGVTRCRTWIDEYAKEPVLMSKDMARETEENRIRHGAYQSKLTRSTLLLDVKRDRRTQPGSDASQPPLETVDSEDSTTLLAAMILRYPTRSLTRWTPSQMKDLGQQGFFYLFRMQTLVNGRLVRARMGGVGQGDFEVNEALGATSVAAVEEDGNCLYLTFIAANPAHKQVRIFCILPAAAANVRHLANCEPFYLLAGKFDSKAAAIRSAGELRARLNGRPEFSDVKIQVWAVAGMGGSDSYHFVVLPRTADLVRQGRVAGLEKFTGTRLPLVPSNSFTVLVQDL